ncbi:hypothetical protein CLOM_g12153 [Closterium sp. NIES-68]|nr:hypothetical protein CLOM_g12153 [Closterium sp. NIES-68]
MTSPSPTLLLLPRVLHAAYTALSSSHTPAAAAASLLSFLCRRGAKCELPAIIRGHSTNLPARGGREGERGAACVGDVWRVWCVRESARSALGFIGSALERRRGTIGVTAGGGGGGGGGDLQTVGASGGDHREFLVQSQPSIFAFTSKEAAGLAQIAAAELAASDWLIEHAASQREASKQQEEGRTEGVDRGGDREQGEGAWAAWGGTGLREGEGEGDGEEEEEERRQTDDREVVLVQVLTRAGGFLEAADGDAGGGKRAGQAIVNELCRLTQHWRLLNNRQHCNETHPVMVEAAWKLLAGLYCTAPDALSRHLPKPEADWEGQVAFHAAPDRYARASETLSSLARALHQLVRSCLPGASSGQKKETGTDPVEGVGLERAGRVKGGEGERGSGKGREVEEGEEERERERERERRTASTLLYLRAMAVAHPMLVLPLLPMLAALLQDLIPLVTCTSQPLKAAAVNAFSSGLVLLSALQPSLLALYNLPPSTASPAAPPATPTHIALTTATSTSTAATARRSSSSSSRDVLAVCVQPYLDLLLTLRLRDKPTVVRLVAQLSDFLLRCCCPSDAAADAAAEAHARMHMETAGTHMQAPGAAASSTANAAANAAANSAASEQSSVRSFELVRAHRGSALGHAAKHFGKVKKLKQLLAVLDAERGEGAGAEGTARGKAAAEPGTGEGTGAERGERGEEGAPSFAKWLSLRARLVRVLHASSDGFSGPEDEWWAGDADAAADGAAAAGETAGGGQVEAVMVVLQEIESAAALEPAKLPLLQHALCLALDHCPFPHSPSVSSLAFAAGAAASGTPAAAAGVTGLPASAGGGVIQPRADGRMVLDVALRLLERMLLHAYSACDRSLIASSLLRLLHSVTLHQQPSLLPLLSSYLPRLLFFFPDHKQQLLDALMHVPPCLSLPPPPAIAIGFTSTPPHSQEAVVEAGKASSSCTGGGGLQCASTDPLLCTVRSIVAVEL